MLAAGLTAGLAHAEDAAAVAGTYCLAGVHEVGSCLRLSADGKFEYSLAYGAYDEASEGIWRLEGNEAILDSPAYDRVPVFFFKRMQPSSSGGFDVVVEGSNGKSLAGIDVAVSCDGHTKAAGVTQAEGFKIDCTAAPTAVALGLSMFGVPPQTINVTSHAGGDKAYVFEFDPGDLGKKKFAAQRLRVTGDALEMTYADTPIRELEGKPFRYVREH